MQQAVHIIPHHQNLSAFLVHRLRALESRDFSSVAIILPTQRLQQYILFELSQHYQVCHPPRLFAMADFVRTLSTFSKNRIISATEQKLILNALLISKDWHYLRPGMENKLLQFFDELAEQNLTSNVFDRINQLLKHDFYRDEVHLKRLSEQTAELQDFYQNYLEFLQKNQLIDEPHALQQAVIALVEQSPKFAFKRYKEIWIAGFSDATEIQIRLFRHLQQHTACAFFLHADAYFLEKSYARDQIEGHFALLCNFLQQLDLDPGQPALKGPESPPPNLTILQHAFASEMPKTTLPKSDITLHAANSLLFEVKAAAALVHKLITTGKTRAEEIMIVVPDEARYSHLIRSIFAEANIPVSDSLGLPMVRTQVGQWLHIMMDLVAGNWRVADVISMLANPLTQSWYAKYHPDIKISDLQEQISQFADAGKIASGLLHDLRQTANKSEHPYKEQAETLLQQLAPAENLSRYLASDAPCAVGEWANKLWALIESFGLEEHVHADVAESTPQEYAALQTLYAQLQHISRLSAILPAPRKLNDFSYLLQQNVFASHIRLDGQAHTGVQIMGLLVARSLPCKVLMILGNNEGSFPASPHREHFYADPFRQKLGLTTHKKLEQLQDQHFYSLVAGAENVHLFYSRQEDERPAVKSRYLQRLELLNRLQHGCIESTNESGLLLAGDFLVSEPAQQLPEAIQEINRTISQQAQKRADARGQFKGKREFIFKQMSPSTIEYLLYCPYRFLLYKLKFSELELPEEDMDSREVGEWLHRVCQHFFEGKTDLHIFSDAELNFPWNEAITEENFERALARLRKMSRELAQTDRSRLDMLYQMEYIGWKNFLEREMQRDTIDYQNSQYEYWLEEKNEHKLHLDPFSVTITGRIDRMARGDGKLRVIDYKTRQSWSRPEVIGGMAPQLPLYVEMLKNKIEQPELQWSAEYFALWNGNTLVLSDELAKKELSESWQNLSENLRKRLTDLLKNQQNMAPEEHDKKCTFCLYEGICRRQENWVLEQDSSAR